jgi:hypothetical protein
MTLSLATYLKSPLADRFVLYLVSVVVGPFPTIFRQQNPIPASTCYLAPIEIVASASHHNVMNAKSLWVRRRCGGGATGPPDNVPSCVRKLFPSGGYAEWSDVRIAKPCQAYLPSLPRKPVRLRWTRKEVNRLSTGQSLYECSAKVIITHAPSMSGACETHARPVEKVIASLALRLC